MRGIKLINIFGHFIIRLFENVSSNAQDLRRFRVEILFSPGYIDESSEINFKSHSRPMKDYIMIHNNLKVDTLVEFFQGML